MAPPEIPTEASPVSNAVTMETIDEIDNNRKKLKELEHTSHGSGAAACNGGTHNIGTGLFGIRWGRLSGEIDALNRLVDKKCVQLVAEAKKKGTALPPEVDAVIRTGKPSTVYKERWTVVPLFNVMFSIGSLGYALHLGLYREVVIAFLSSYVYYDFFSGILHVLHDNPLLMKVPLTHDPCLEFQWHHHIPQDIASKSFLEVCGDLNLIIATLLVVYFAPAIGPFRYGFGYTLADEPLAVCFACSKMLMSFFGQLSHSMCHMPPHRRPTWVQSLQYWGIMLNPKEHAVHHKSYDDNFCVGNGWFNSVITYLLKLSNKTHHFFGGSSNTNALFWLTAFVILLFADVPMMVCVVKLLPSYIGVGDGQVIL